MFDEEPYVFLASLGKYTPIKKIHCSQIRKAIMHRSQLNLCTLTVDS